MIHELEGKKLYNEFDGTPANHEDRVFIFDSEEFAVGEDGLPRASDFDGESLTYLFKINKERYFLAQEPIDDGKYMRQTARNLRRLESKEMAFAAATAYHLYQWYTDNKFCGRCGRPLSHKSEDRSLYCVECGNVIYPKIAPAVIVAVTYGDKILLTKYRDRVYKKYALISGFTEIGESLEETVSREVFEEVGLKVKNITYYKSQPWGTDSNILAGFFAELDGSDNINIDNRELAEAEWITREELNAEDDGFSLTREMMQFFKEGKLKCMIL